jgi:hypothetical protein
MSVGPLLAMPDLLTHLLVAQACRKGVRGGVLTPWFLVGTVLPDVFTRPFSIAFRSLFWFFMPLHTPVGLFVLCALISNLLPAPSRRSVFYNLLSGAALHLLLDACQIHMAGGYYLLFPFSWWSFEFGLFWPETSLYFLPLWIGVGLVLAIRLLGRRHNHPPAPFRPTVV